MTWSPTVHRGSYHRRTALLSAYVFDCVYFVSVDYDSTTACTRKFPPSAIRLRPLASDYHLRRYDSGLRPPISAFSDTAPAFGLRFPPSAIRLRPLASERGGGNFLVHSAVQKNKIDTAIFLYNQWFRCIRMPWTCLDAFGCVSYFLKFGCIRARFSAF